eukprot:jgi/Mesvir1/5036/Mv02241-RA.1
MHNAPAMTKAPALPNAQAIPSSHGTVMPAISLHPHTAQPSPRTPLPLLFPLHGSHPLPPPPSCPPLLAPQAEEVLEGLLEHGRLTVGQVVERAAARTQGGPATKDKVMRAFVSLVQQGFVERAPPHSPALPTPAELSGTEAPAPGTRQRANKALSRAQITQAAATATERAAAVASSTALIPAVDRFRLPSTMIKYADDGTGGGTAAMEVEAILASARPLSGAPTGGIVAGSNASAAANKDKDKDKEEDAGGKKRKAPGGDVTVQSNADVKGLEAAQRAVSQVDEREMLWRANYDEFLHRARIEEIKRFVRARYDPLSEAIVDVMMTANRRWLATDKEPPLISPDSVVELLTEKAAKRPKLDPLNDREAPSLAEVEAAMYTMCLGKEPVKAITRLTASHYGVNVKEIIDELRALEVAAIIKGRFGVHGCRLFRLLLMKGILEQKQIADMAMMPVKDTREMLYRLMKFEYISLQEVARTGDHAPSRTFYLWKVDVGHVIQLISTEILAGASHLRTRLQYEMSQEKELLAHFEKQSRNGLPVNLTVEQRRRLEQMRHVTSMLETSLLRLGKQILLFRNF